MTYFTIWENAVALQDAYVHFALRQDADCYQRLWAENSFAAMMERAEKRHQQGVTGWDLLSGSGGSYSEHSKLERRLRDQCLQWIRTGKLQAYGFSAPRKSADEPVEVPRDLWDGFIRWDSSVVERHGLRMEGVRLITPARIDEIRVGLSAQKQAPGPGRRSRKAQIIVAFESLLSHDQIDFDKPMTRLFPVIRDWIMHAYQDDPDGETGLDDKTLRKHISGPFNARKRDSKL